MSITVNDRKGMALRRWTLLSMVSVAVGWLSLGITSCSSIDCPVQNTVYTVYAIYNSGGEAVALLDTMTIWSCRADGTDTVLFNRGVNTSTFNLPIGYATPEDTLLLGVYSGGSLIVDTMWVKKENYPHFESVDCSATFFHRITDVRCTHQLLDSVVINNPNVNYDASKEHFHLYFHTSD